jgi:hypothetical protein
MFGTVRADKLTRSKFKSPKPVIPCLFYLQQLGYVTGRRGWDTGRNSGKSKEGKLFNGRPLDIPLTPLVMFLGARVRCAMSSKRRRCAKDNALTLVNSRNLHLEVISFYVREEIV